MAACVLLRECSWVLEHYGADPRPATRLSCKHSPAHIRRNDLSAESKIPQWLHIPDARDTLVASACIGCFVLRSRNRNRRRNRNPDRGRADASQQPLPVNLFCFTVKVYVAPGRPGRLAG